MAKNCKVKYSQDGTTPIEVYADNGNVSKLYKDLLRVYGDPNIAYDRYLTMYTKEFKDKLGDAKGVMDKNNEPHFSTILRFHKEDNEGMTVEDNPEQFVDALKGFLKGLNIEVLSDKNTDQILRNLENYHFKGDKSRSILAFTDLIQGFLAIKSDPTNKYLLEKLPEHTAMFMFELLGRKNKLYKSIWNNIDKLDKNGKEIYPDYWKYYKKWAGEMKFRPLEAYPEELLVNKSIEEVRDEQDELKELRLKGERVRFNANAHKRAIIAVLADKLKERFGQNNPMRSDAVSEDVDQNYFKNRGFMGLNYDSKAYEKPDYDFFDEPNFFKNPAEWIYNWVSKVWNLIMNKFKSPDFINLDADQFGDLLTEIVDDALSGNLKKWLRDIEFSDDRLTMADGSVLELKPHQDIFRNDPKAEELVDFYTQQWEKGGLGGLLSGSAVLRGEGTLYRPAKEDFHDIDGSIPYNVFTQQKKLVNGTVVEYDKVVRELIERAIAGDYLKHRTSRSLTMLFMDRGAHARKVKNFQKDLWSVIQQMPFMERFMQKYPNAKLRFLFVGKDAPKGESVTITMDIPGHGMNGESRVVDFFLRTMQRGIKYKSPEGALRTVMYPETTGRFNFKNYIEIIAAKFKMGRAKDIMDIIHFRNYIEDRYKGKPSAKGFRFVDVINRYQENENFYQLEPSRQEKSLETQLNDANKVDSIDWKMNVLFDQWGVDVKNVQQILDAKGKAIDAAAVARLTKKVVEIVKSKANATTLSEEAAHFFVALLKTQKNPLYDSMMNSIDQYELYNEVVTNPQYREAYADSPNIETLLKEEAIGKAITQHIFNQEMGTEKPAKVARMQRWYDKVWNFIKKLFSKFVKGSNNYDPFAEASLQMLAQASWPNLNDPEGRPEGVTSDTYTFEGNDMYQTTDESNQDRIVKEILEMNSKLAIEQLKKDGLEVSEDVREVLSESVEGETVERMVFTDENGKKYPIKNNMGDKAIKELIRKRGKERAKEILSSDYAKHRRKNNSRVHAVSQLLAEWWGRSRKHPNVEVINQSNESRTESSIKQISKMNNITFNSLKEGVQYVIQQINLEEDAISNGQGKVKILTQGKIYEEVADESADVDIIAVFSNGQIGLYNFGTMTPTKSQVVGKGQDKYLRADSNPHQWNLGKWNTKLSIAKAMLKRVHSLQESDFRQTRVAPIWIEYKSKKTEEGYTPTNVINFIRMDHAADGVIAKIEKELEPLREKMDMETATKKEIKRASELSKQLDDLRKKHRQQTALLKHISAAKELIYSQTGEGYKKLNNLLGKLYDRKEKLQQDLDFRKRKVDRAKVQSALNNIEKQIQRLTVSKNLGEVIWETNNSIAKLIERRHITDENDPNYLHIDDLTEIQNDLMLYQNINQDVSEYLKDWLTSKDPEVRESGRIQKMAVEQGAYTVSEYLVIVENEIDDRLTKRAQSFGEDITAPSVERGYLHKQFKDMGQIDNPVFRAAYSEIFYNKYDNVESELREANKEIAGHKKAIEEWAKANGVSLRQALERLWTKKINQKGEYYDKALVPVLSPEFWKLVKSKQKAGSVAWMQKYLKYNSRARERYNANLKQMEMIIDRESSDVLQYNPNTKKMDIVEDKSKIRQARLIDWKKKNDIFSKNPLGEFMYPEAWLNPNWTEYLEANIEALEKDDLPTYTNEYRFLIQPENKALLDFYNYHKDWIEKIKDLTGFQLGPTFMAEVTDSTADTLLNNGFFRKNTWLKVWDNITRQFLAKDEEQTYGIFDEKTGELMDQIPFLFVNAIRDPSGNRDGTIKTAELFKSLSLLIQAAHMYKYGLEVNAWVDAYYDYLTRHNLEVSTTPGGKIIRDQFDNIRTRPVSKDTLNLFKRHQRVHIFGQRIQTKDQRLGPISLNKTVMALKSFDSLRKLAFAVLPGIAARTVGGINMLIEGIDGAYWTNKEYKEAQLANIRREKWVFALAEIINPYQQNVSYEEQLKLSTNKLNKYFDMSRLYSFLREPDENMDMVGLAAMSLNYGIDKNGLPARLDTLPKGSKSIAEMIKEQIKKGVTELTIPGMSATGYKMYRRMIRNIMEEIKGNMSDEQMLAINTELVGNTLMAYKSWMPGIVTARFGGKRYDNVVKRIKEGRFSGWIQGSKGDFLKGLEEERKVAALFKGIASRGKDAVLELSGIKKIKLSKAERAEKIEKGKKEGKPNKYWSKKDEARYQEARKALKREMDEWKKNSTDPKIQNVTLDEFVELRQRSLKRTIAEIQIYIIFGILLNLMGMGVGPDDEKFYNQNFALRKIYQIFNRTRLELGFTIWPSELGVMLRGGIPLIGLFTDMSALIDSAWESTLAEAGLVVKSPNKNPTWYHILKFTPGGTQINRIVEAAGRDPYIK